MIQTTYDIPIFLKKVQATYKKEGIDYLKDFKPINLIGRHYKLLTKVLAYGLRK